MLNDRLVTYIERDVLLTISNDAILVHFQRMNMRRDFHCNVLYQTILFLIFNIVCIIVSLKFLLYMYLKSGSAGNNYHLPS